MGCKAGWLSSFRGAREIKMVVEVFESNAFWSYPRRGILNMSTQEDALRQIQDTLERL